MIRTRFSPSPTGLMHIGNARAALFSALYAHQGQGTFILRIEDTDVTRSEERFSESLQDDLHWLDIHWQEGPGTEGKCGPYWQSQRQGIYEHYFYELEKKNLVYPCFCSEQELALARKVQLGRGLPPRYSGTCFKLSPEERAKRIEQGAKPTVRFHVPEKKLIEFVDLVKGHQRFQSDDIGDFIIRRADGTFPFLFSNAIDDATMGVTHVIRGDDHLANTPRQILLLQALELPISHYAHLSMITGNDGTPLSKRHGSFSVSDLRERGFLPQALINYLGRLGHTYESQALMSFPELAADFRIEKLGRSPARFDESQLLFWQKTAVQMLDKTAFWRWLGEGIQRQVPVAEQDLFFQAVRANIDFPHDAAIWASIFFSDQLTFSEEEKAILISAGEQFFVEAEQAAEKYGTDFKQILADMKKSLNISGKHLFMPLRIALTGKMHGPELAHVAELLGAKKVKHRFGQVVSLVSK